MKSFVLITSFILSSSFSLLAQSWVWGLTNNGGRFGVGTIFRYDKENDIYETVHDLHPTEGGFPFAPLLESSDGNFYGTTTSRGKNGSGSIFRITPQGKFDVLYHFDLCDGANPFSGLTEGSKGMLYGMTTDGGNNGFGTIFTLAPDGTAFRVLWHFSSEDGARPEGALIRGDDGAFYGMTSEGGRFGMGTMFRFTGDGNDLSILHHFSWDDGAYPYGSILQNCDGLLYGVTHCGGKNSVGTVFRIRRNGSDFKVLHHFDPENGGHPYSDLIEGCDGVLYGTTNDGGKHKSGTVFSIGTDGKGFKVLHHLNYAMDGSNPESGLREDNGVLYGTTSYGGKYWGGTIFSIRTDGSDFRIMRQLNPDEGNHPHSTLTLPRPEVARAGKLEQKIMVHPRVGND